MSRGSLYSVTLDGRSVAVKRQEILAYFNDTYELFERVFELLKDESVFYKKSEPTRHPMIFYFGHTATFFINKLINMKILEQRVNPEFESIFAVGVDEMAWDEVDSAKYAWPSVHEVREYRAKVKKIVQELIMEMPLSLPIDDASAMWIILMGIEHERIHIETSLVLHRQMPLDFVQSSSHFPLCQKSSSKYPKNEMMRIAAKDVRLGVDKEKHHLYGWDNEYGRYEECVPDFKCSKYLVSNGEFMEFVLNGGYTTKRYWDAEGLAFLKRSGALHPPFWVAVEGGFRYRALGEEIDMPMDWPVDVNALEAEAFCRYKSEKESVTYQLPSESEYRVLYEYADLEDIPNFDDTKANCNFAHYASSMPVDSFAFNGIYDITGNVWQWSRTPIDPFEGFEVHEAYDDFSVPTFDAKHALILGASWASSGNLITKNSRYAFRKHFYQNAGFRYVESSMKESKKMDIYESDALVSQYCEFQYGTSYFGVENFAVSTAKIATQYAKQKRKALDLGCATGRASFELAKHFDAVEGVDFSVRFIQVGSKLKDAGYIAYTSVEEGEIVSHKSVSIDDLGYKELAKRVSFWQGDACNLKPNFRGYDLIMATNLIDRLYNPKLFLEDVASRLNDAGLLVLTSPYTWQESSTKKEFWLGGYYDAEGNEVRTIDTLEKILSAEFTLIHREDVPFVIKESARKFQHTLSELSVWRKK